MKKDRYFDNEWMSNYIHYKVDMEDLQKFLKE